MGSDGKEKLLKMSCLTISISELGTFLRLDDEQLMSFLIRMWDGQNDIFRHRTKQSGNVEVENPWLNFIGATTPSWLQENFPEAMVGGGLTSRMVFIYGDKKRWQIPYPDEVVPTSEHEQLRADLTHDLIEISKLSGPFMLTDFARDWGRVWYKEHHDPDLRPPHLISKRFEGYLARKQTHIHKLAIILSAAKRDDRRIEAKDLEDAESIMSDVERYMVHIFDYIGAGAQKNLTQEITNTLNHFGWMTDAGLFRRCMNQMSRREYLDAIEAAIKGGLIKVCTGSNGQVGFGPTKKGP
jgi:hypothetical protein